MISSEVSASWAAEWQALRPQQWRRLNRSGDILMKIGRQLDPHPPSIPPHSELALGK